jgi:EF hand
VVARGRLASCVTPQQIRGGSFIGHGSSPICHHRFTWSTSRIDTVRGGATLMTNRVALFSAAGVAAGVSCVIGIALAGRAAHEVGGIGEGRAVTPSPAPASVPISGEAGPRQTAGPADTAAFVLSPLFHTLDCEGEGVIRADEVDEHIAQALSVYNRDDTRTITRGEYLRATEGALRERRAALFVTIDTNRDEVLSAKEFARHLVAAIDQADTNRDGEVTRRELEQRH